MIIKKIQKIFLKKSKKIYDFEKIKFYFKLFKFLITFILDLV
jgi:hypothetical protein